MEKKWIGEILKNARKNKGLTQKQVMEITNINCKSLSGYENNVAEPDLDTFSKLIELYDLSADEIFEISNGKQKISYWKKMFKKVDDEIEVTKVLESENHKRCMVYYLMPYSNTENEFVFNMDVDPQEVIDGFCLDVRERANEMILHIKECSNSVEDYFSE